MPNTNSRGTNMHISTIVNLGFEPNATPGVEALGLGLNVNIEMPSLKLGAIEVLLTLVPSDNISLKVLKSKLHIKV